MNQPPDPSVFCSDFIENLKKMNQFHELLVKFNNKIPVNDFKKRKVLTETQNILSAIKIIWKNAAPIIMNMKEKDSDILYEPLSIPLRSALIPISESEKAANDFIESEGTDMSLLDTFVEGLFSVNKHLQDLHGSPAWNEIFNIRMSEFVIKSEAPESNTSNSPLYYQSVSDYINIAKYCDIEDEELLTILKHILDPVQRVFVGGRFYEPKKCEHYSAIVGPSFMGKTQFSFILARIHPVFYFNFCANGSMLLQKVYQNFKPYRDHLINILNQDMELEIFSDLNNENIKYAYSSENIVDNNDVKLLIIGFIWKLIEYSLEFDFTADDGNWFDRYLKPRSFHYEALSLKDFYEKMEKLFEDENKKSKFKIPIVFIDELNVEYSRHIKFLRNVVRCLVLPCVLASTDAKVNNMLNLKSSSSLAMHVIWVNCIRRLLAANLTGIMKCIGVKSSSLFEYLNEDYSFKVSEDENSVIRLLRDLEITFNDGNKKKLLNIWNFMISQSKSCLQGSSYYAFSYFIQELKLYEGKTLNSCALWSKICEEMYKMFKSRKPLAFVMDGKFFSLRMFGTDKKFVASRNKANSYEEIGKVEAMLVRNSIDNHFYHFGEENEPSVLPFSVMVIEDGQELELVYERKLYPIKSHFLPFENDFFTAFSLWNKVAESYTIASIVQKYKNSLADFPSNPSAQKNNSNAQEIMTYWALANASHQNFDGNTGGIEFFKNFFENIQVCSVYMNNIKIPIKLESFLRTLSVPYLIPEQPSAEFKSSLAGLCNFGAIRRCPDETGLDVEFKLSRNGRDCSAYVECKYRDDPQGKTHIESYIDKAKSKNSVLTFFVSYRIHDSLKENNPESEDVVNEIDEDLNEIDDYPAEKDADPEEANRPKRQAAVVALANINSEPVAVEPEKKKSKSNFKLNIYSFYFKEDEKAVDKGNQKKILAMKTIKEVNNPDGVFIVLETTFNVKKSS